MGKTAKVELTPWGKRLVKKIKDAEKRRVKVGVLAAEGAKVYDDDGKITMIGIAAVNEFGSRNGHVPERSFIRRTFTEKETEVKAFCEKLLKAIMTKGEMSVERALNILGAFAATEVKKTITEGDGVPPPNAPATIRRKKSARPLVHNQRLLGSITYEVVDDE